MIKSSSSQLFRFVPYVVYNNPYSREDKVEAYKFVRPRVKTDGEEDYLCQMEVFRDGQDAAGTPANTLSKYDKKILSALDILKLVEQVKHGDDPTNNKDHIIKQMDSLLIDDERDDKSRQEDNGKNIGKQLVDLLIKLFRDPVAAVETTYYLVKELWGYLSKLPRSRATKIESVADDVKENYEQLRLGKNTLEFVRNQIDGLSKISYTSKDKDSEDCLALATKVYKYVTKKATASNNTDVVVHLTKLAIKDREEKRAFDVLRDALKQLEAVHSDKNYGFTVQTFEKTYKVWYVYVNTVLPDKINKKDLGLISATMTKGDNKRLEGDTVTSFVTLEQFLAIAGGATLLAAWKYFILNASPERRSKVDKAIVREIKVLEQKKERLPQARRPPPSVSLNDITRVKPLSDRPSLGLRRPGF